MRITIRDIAKATGVSVGTVSKVFNGYTTVGKDTRERILQAAAEFEYSPSHSARQLAGGFADTIGVVLNQFGEENSRDEYLIGILSGIYYEAEQKHLRVAMFTAKYLEKVNQNYVQFCRSNRLIGLIVHGYDMSDEKLVHLAESDIPCVAIDIVLPGSNNVTITTDNISATFETVEALVSFGHKKIVFVSGREKAWVTQQRLLGYKKGIKKHGLKPIILQADYNIETSFECVTQFLTQNADTDAFCCVSDGIACGALSACTKLNFKVPEDISIVGFDNLTISGVTNPPLSTVEQNFYQMGGISVNTLLSLSKQEKTPKQINIPHKFIFRASTIKR
jgi:DNA-binding LacI/PurR family transcriptional regulator